MMDSSEHQRMELCKFLGFMSLSQVHEFICSGLRRNAEFLIQRGLNSKTLIQFGYTRQGLHRLGFSDETLHHLGFSMLESSASPPVSPASHPASRAASASSPRQSTAEEPPDIADEIRQRLSDGARAPELRQSGIMVQHCRRLGMSATELRDLGFCLEELAQICDAPELLRAQFSIRDLVRFYDGYDLRKAGCSSEEMRLAGYTVRDLINFGYSDNNIRCAGYSNAELIREGLTRTTHIPH